MAYLLLYVEGTAALQTAPQPRVQELYKCGWEVTSLLSIARVVLLAH
jgi:hypothetical protein